MMQTVSRLAGKLAYLTQSLRPADCWTLHDVLAEKSKAAMKRSAAVCPVCSHAEWLHQNATMQQSE